MEIEINFKKLLHEKIESIKIETNQNKRYGISLRNNDPILKSKLKALLPPSNHQYPSTYIEIKIGKSLEIDVKNSPIYIYGEYSKIGRSTTQTKHSILGDSSVEDFKLPLEEFFDSKIKFISSGREDVDVQMLGFRPFLLEVIEPKKNLIFSKLEIEKNKNVTIKNLKRVTVDLKKIMHENQEKKEKTYKIRFFCENMRLFKEKYFILQQKTPLRVLHRRANLVRERKIEILHFDVDEKWGNMIVKSQAGTYIKEFVHGDFGRTKPSLTSILGSYADCVELDVLDVDKCEIDEKNIILEILIEEI